ncbi:chromosomal replication initiator protein DnaA [bacterium]|nr:chromosomal replication initiator protein DnaA [bacterium]RKZ27992.1 MAG: chromosomal replication initiator protein DnaA [bacterium]
MALQGSGFWEQCLQIISARINAQSYRTWFEQTWELKYDDDAVVIAVKNQFVADWLSSNYTQLIVDIAYQVAGKEIGIKLAIPRNGGYEEILLDVHSSNDSAPSKEVGTLNPRYTFENFVVGDFNSLAHYSAMAVADNPGGTKYNPLYIHGGVGLGKTHLLHAIGHQIKQTKPDLKVIAVTSERFIDLYITSIINKTTSRFNEVYRSADVLLVDDIQFFSGKEGIQNAFFHIFNALHHRGQQIVLTSDMPPAKIAGLEERLRSRFEWGLMVDMQQPNYEGRMAILRQKAESDGIEIPDEVLSLIAQSVTSNIRELEGTLIRLLATASIYGREIDEKLALDVIGQYGRPILSLSEKITLEDILKIVSQHIGVSPELLRGKRRTKQVALARQIAMYLARKYTGSSLQHIGNFFGRRDHSTVVHACKIIPQKDGEVQRIVSQIESELDRRTGK